MGAVDSGELSPEGDAGEADEAEEEAEGEAGGDFAAHDAPPIAGMDFAESHGPDEEAGGLGAGVAAGGDDQGNEEGEHHSAFQLVFEEAHGSGGEHFADEEEDEPDVEEYAERFEKAGMTMLDVVSLWLGQFSKKNAKYTDDYIEKLGADASQIMDDIEREHDERTQMVFEDQRPEPEGEQIVAVEVA